MQLTASTLVRMEISTWRTDAGDLDVLTDIPDRDGRHMRYAELIGRASELHLDRIVVRVAALEDVIASKEWANRPKDRDASPNSARFKGSSRGPRPSAKRRPATLNIGGPSSL